MKNLTLFQKFSFLFLAAMIGFCFCFGWIITKSIEHNMLVRTAHITLSVVTSAVKTEFRIGELILPKFGAEYDSFSERIENLSIGPYIERIKIWDKNMIVIWADKKELVGQDFTGNKELSEALKGNLSPTYIKPYKLEHMYEYEFENLLEIYIPISFISDDNVDVVFEIYQNLDQLYADISYEKIIVWVSTVSGFGLLYLALIAIIWNASKRIEIQTRLLSQTEKTFRNIFEHPNDSIVILDRPERQLYPDVFWLIRLRWVAIAGVAITTVGAVYLDMVDTGFPILFIAGVMGACNTCLWWRYRRKATQIKNESINKEIIPQILLDLGSLTALLHFSGGVENPFVMFFAFHMAIGAVFLPHRTVWYIGLAAGLLHGGTVISEFYKIIPHHPISFARFNIQSLMNNLPTNDLYETLGFIFAYLFAFFIMLVGVIYLVQTVAQRQRLSEAIRQEHERVALSRERLARIGEITAGVAHTIRNPLYGVISGMELLLKKLSIEDTTSRENCTSMLEALDRIERVTNRLLTLTRDSPLNIVATDIQLLLKDSLKFVETRAQKKNIRLSSELGEVPAVLLDPDRFMEALINLLDNAIDACRAGDTITVGNGLWGDPGNGVCIWVEDTGEGISAEHHNRVFDPFFTTKPVGEGAGLGLAIARRIVEERGGELLLESTVGAGTTVRIVIPSQFVEGFQEMTTI